LGSIDLLSNFKKFALYGLNFGLRERFERWVGMSLCFCVHFKLSALCEKKECGFSATSKAVKCKSGSITKKETWICGLSEIKKSQAVSVSSEEKNHSD